MHELVKAVEEKRVEGPVEEDQGNEPRLRTTTCAACAPSQVSARGMLTATSS